MRGALSNVWFDRHKISQDCPEHLESIDSMCDNLSAIVQDEIRAGIPKHRMVIGMATGLSLSYLLHNSLFLSSPSIYLSLPYCFLCLTHSHTPLVPN